MCRSRSLAWLGIHGLYPPREIPWPGTAHPAREILPVLDLHRLDRGLQGLTLLLGQLSGSSHRVHAGEWGTSSWSREETGDVKDGFGEDCICVNQRRGLGRVRLAKPELATPS